MSAPYLHPLCSVLIWVLGSSLNSLGKSRIENHQKRNSMGKKEEKEKENDDSFVLSFSDFLHFVCCCSYVHPLIHSEGSQVESHQERNSMSQPKQWQRGGDPSDLMMQDEEGGGRKGGGWGWGKQRRSWMNEWMDEWIYEYGWMNIWWHIMIRGREQYSNEWSERIDERSRASQ